MTWDLKISAEAERTINEQMLWYEADDGRGGASLANRWLDLLEKALHKLSDHPERHGYAPENGRWQSHLGLRQLLFRPWKSKPGWRVIFSLDEENGNLEVLQIRHERRPRLSE